MHRRASSAAVVAITMALTGCGGGTAIDEASQDAAKPIAVRGATSTPLPRLTATPTPRPSNCDPAYPTVCIPPGPPLEFPCAITTARNFPVLPPDPRGLDSNGDGVGCEPVPTAVPLPPVVYEPAPAQASNSGWVPAPAPAPAPALSGCHPSYVPNPDGSCVPYSSLNLNCDDIGWGWFGLYDVYTDPYGLDDYRGPGNGVTCDGVG